MDKLLLQFKGIVEYKNMTKASEKLYVDRSTLSKNMDSLENKLNILLLKRTNKGIHITKEGLILYESICKMNRTYEDALNEIKALSINNDVLHIGSDLAINYDILLNALTKFQENYPHMTIHLKKGTSYEISQAILDNEIDIFIGTISKKTYNTPKLAIRKMDIINYDLFINNENLLISEPNIHQTILNDPQMFNWYFMNNSDVMNEFLHHNKLKPHMNFTSSDLNTILNIAQVDHKACLILPRNLMNQAIEHNLGIYPPFNLTLELYTGIIYKNINQKESLKLFLYNLK